MAVFILQDALSVQRDNASSPFLYLLKTHHHLHELRQHLWVVWLCVSSIETVTRCIMRLGELSFEMRLERRTSKDSLSQCIMRLVPVFMILETHNQTN